MPESEGRIWVLDDGELRSARVRLGVTDGSATALIEVVDARPGATAITDGVQLVTNVTTPDVSAGATPGNSGSPLIPQFPFGRRGR